MAPMPPKQPAAGTQGAYCAPAPTQVPQPGFGRGPVDFTNQESFAQDVDTSPYASAKSAKRAAKSLGKRPAPTIERAAQPGQEDVVPQANPPVAIPGTVDIRSQMHVVVGGAHQVQARPTVSNQAQRAQRAANRTVKAAEPKPRQTPESSEAAEQFPAEEQYIEAAERAARERPAASRAGVARPRPRPATASAQQGDSDAPDRQAVKRSIRTSGIITAPRDTEEFIRRAAMTLTCLACVVVTCVTLYTPAQQLYSAMRENERLTNELAQNQARVDALQKSVSSLQTAEGVQDMAHKTWGLVMPDEVPITVDNAPYTPADTPIPAEVKRGSGENSSTWVTDILDQVFGEAGSTTAVQSDESVATLSETDTSTQVTSALPVQG